MLGPATLFLLAGTIAQKGNGWFTPASIAFLIVMVVIVVTRQFDPEDADGEPTTPAHLRRFTVGAIGGGLTAWVIANLLGNHWLTS